MEWLIRSDEEPAEGFGKKPEERSVEELLKNGFVVLDKWQGPTSHDVVATVKKVLGLNKTGHAGTLDPMVSGVLLVTLENACKVIPALQGLDKEYAGVMHLHKETDAKKLSATVKKFLGDIRQRPPVRSAVARKERTRRVHSFDILEISGKDVLFKTSVEAGTYIRVLCHDIGKHLGGAHMSELRRTKAGPFGEEQSVKMHDIADAFVFWKENGDDKIRDYVLPVEKAVDHLKKIVVKDSAVFSVAGGTPLYTQGICKIRKGIEKDDLIALITLKGELVALAMAAMSSDEMMHRKGLAAKTDRVIMEKGVYPKMRQHYG
ncbi:MAG: RNA-guided pseudouridylation complex pseudouridine synthase subunit Cbf5 [Candidatus Aenigmarchaeota archaeon]|nr:RNA-guided pseudouridylation complex pseudouridine synthase subunit Cbf5 [Candidatus Aenigmarchaeota archaeon]